MGIGTLAGRFDLRRLFRLAFRIRPNSEYVVFRGQRLTRRQTLARIEALAAGLWRLGLRKGEWVAALLPACPEAVYASFLPVVAGITLVPLHPLLSEEELRHVLADCGAKVVIIPQRWMGRDYPAMLARLLPHLPDLRHVVVAGLEEGDGRVFLPLAQVMASGESLPWVRVSARDVSYVLYSSGTTGQPKGAVLTFGSTGGTVRAGIHRLAFSALRCLLLPFPLHHFAGLFGLMAALLGGGKVVLMDRLNPYEMLETIGRERVTQVGAPPTLYRLLLRTPGQERYDLSSLRRVTLAAEPCPPELAQALHERLGCPLENMYGLTETQVISWTAPNDPWERVATTVGRPLPGVRVRIVDDDRRPLGAGQVGEIAVRSPQIMRGYHRAPELTARVLDGEGWFYTGDLGYMDEDGYLRLVDRKKDLIVRGGQNVYPAEVERRLRQHPLVRQAGVIGVPDPIGGEAIWAYVEPQPGAELSAEGLLAYCQQGLAPFKMPERVRFVERLPVTATGKVQKFKLREMAAQELAASAAKGGGGGS